jgi:hypothetical protein
MEKTSWRTRGLEWFTSHALWELAKFASVALFAWLISLGYARMMNAALGTAFNIFLILIGIVGLLWALGLIPALRKPAHGLDREKLSELRTRGHQLLSSTPRAGASPSDLIRFWDEEIGLWTSATAMPSSMSKIVASYPKLGARNESIERKMAVLLRPPWFDVQRLRAHLPQVAGYGRSTFWLWRFWWTMIPH